MGLDTSHDCWHGGYGVFMIWRKALAHAAGLPPLDFMEGFYDDQVRAVFSADSGPFTWHRTMWTQGLPIRWSCLRPDVLYELLDHSDCDGELKAHICAPLAERLDRLYWVMDGWKEDDPYFKRREDYMTWTERFAAGLRDAAEANENVEFG